LVPLDSDGKPEVCAWSYQYRDNYPLSFTIRTESGEPLSDFAHTIRVFRNGKLIFAWKDDNVLASLNIPGQVLAASLMPYGAPMDLRIIPAGSPDDPTVDTQVAQSVDPVLSRLKIVEGVLLGPQGPGAPVFPEIACVRWMVLKAQATALQIVGKTPPTTLPQQPAGCSPPADGPATAVHDKIVVAIQSGAQTVNNDIETAIAGLRTQYGGAIAAKAEKAKAAVIADYKDKPLPNGLTSDVTVDQINQLAEQGAQIFDSIDASVKAVLANARQLVKDRDAQAREFAAVTDALAQNGSVFEAFTKDPALVDGEKSLDMHYGDRFQFFFLAPWHGLPIRVTRNVGTDLTLATAIPILDLAGFRYQRGTGRSQSVRLGAGFMYFKDELQEVPLGATTSQTDSVFNVAAEANVNWFGFSVGAGYVLNDRNFGGFWKSDRIRVIVGADLLKLFGNTAAEVYSH
jgi:hypothetical protein